MADIEDRSDEIIERILSDMEVSSQSTLNTSEEEEEEPMVAHVTTPVTESDVENHPLAEKDTEERSEEKEKEKVVEETDENQEEEETEEEEEEEETEEAEETEEDVEEKQVRYLQTIIFREREKDNEFPCIILAVGSLLIILNILRLVLMLCPSTVCSKSNCTYLN